MRCEIFFDYTTWAGGHLLFDWSPFLSIFLKILGLFLYSMCFYFLNESLAKC